MSKFLAVLIVVPIIILCSCQPQRTEKAVADGSLVAVLCDYKQGNKWKGRLTPSAVYIIDTGTQTVIRKIATRSPAYDLAAGRNGKLYTSNSGGLGHESDHAIAVINPRNGEIERYIELDIIPGHIAVAGDDLFVNSGLYFPETEEVAWKKISLIDHKIISFKVPGVTFSPIYHNGKIYTNTSIKEEFASQENIVSIYEYAPDLVVPDRQIYWSLLVLNINTLETRTVIDREVSFGRDIAFDEKGNAFGLISRAKWRKVHKDTIVVFKPEELLITDVVSLPAQSEPAGGILYHNGMLYISYYDQDSMKGGDIVVYETKSFSPVKVLNGFDGPVDMTINEGNLFVLCNGNSNTKDGRVAVVDIDKMQVINSIPVGGNPLRIVPVPVN